MTTATATPTESTTVAPAPVVRKFKASDLPLTTATRTAIEGLAHSFKKQGGYDAIRKQVWEKFEASDYENQVTKSILGVAEKELERNPSQLLTLDRRKAAALIDGALDRSGVYQQAEEVIDQLIDVKAIENHIRGLRKADIGEEAALAEQEKGSKTDQDYAQESALRLQEREDIRRILREKEEQIEEEKRKIEREERKRREREAEKAEAKRLEERDARRREREAKDAEREIQRQKERDERRAAREKEREEREKEREARIRSRDQRREKRSRSRSRDRRDRNRVRSRSRRRDSRERRRRDRSREGRERHRPEEVKKSLSKEELERLERDALADLLRESKRNAEPQQPEMEIDEALAPPPKKTKPASAIQPIRRESSKNMPEGKRVSTTTKTEPKDASTESKAAKETKDVKDTNTSTKETKETKISSDKPAAKEPPKVSKASVSGEERRGKPVPVIELETMSDASVIKIRTETVIATVRLNGHENVTVPVTPSGTVNEIVSVIARETATGIGREIAANPAGGIDGKGVDPGAESVVVHHRGGLRMRTITVQERLVLENVVLLDVEMIGTDELGPARETERREAEAGVVSAAGHGLATIGTGVIERIVERDRDLHASGLRERTEAGHAYAPSIENGADLLGEHAARSLTRLANVQRRLVTAGAGRALALLLHLSKTSSRYGKWARSRNIATVLEKIDAEIVTTTVRMPTASAIVTVSETGNGIEIGMQTEIEIDPGNVDQEITMPEMTAATEIRIAIGTTEERDVVAKAGAGAGVANVTEAESAIARIVTGTEIEEADASAARTIGVTEGSVVAVDPEGAAELRVNNARILQPRH
ncbi:hypothetical protein E8E14_011660 [Neopestalotiopsis sp. 37M]|nr:hypothetical protein E8E14_011660 [Neopestalotiopsis sp. 37M]